MKKNLTRTSVTPLLYHYIDESRREGPNDRLTGDCSGLRGDCTGLTGDCTGLTGDCFGLTGDCTGLRGDLDQCEISDAERAVGVAVASLAD
jgi:hypothetical protein